MMADRGAIENVLASWALGYDQREPDRMARCFTAGAVMTLSIGGTQTMGPYVGHAQVMKHFTDHHLIQTDQRRHVISNVVVDSESDTEATVFSNLTLVVVDQGTTQVRATGIYRDRFVLDDGAWKIAERFLRLDSHY